MSRTDMQFRARGRYLPALLLTMGLAAACSSDSGGPDSDPDPVPLALDSIVPPDNAVDLEITSSLWLYFDTAANPASITPITVTLTTGGAAVPSAVSYESGTESALVTAPLLPGTTYTLTGTTGIQSTGGVPLAIPGSSTFTTRAPRTITLNPMAPNNPIAIVARPGGGMAILYTWNQAYALICDGDCTANATSSSVPIDTIEGTYAGDLAIDGNGVLHATYTDPNSDRLHYARCASNCLIRTSWNTTVVDSNVYAHFGSALAVDGNTVHLVYEDATVNDVHYATCSADCTTFSGWTRGAAETAGAVGGTRKLIVNGGRLHTSWFDFSAQRLRYATCATGCTTPAGWASTPIDQAGTLGAYPSLGVGPSGTIYISYTTTGPYQIFLANCSSSCETAASWTRTFIEDGGGSGPAENALLVSGDGRLGVVHFKVSTADLRYSTCATACTVSSNWRSTALDSNGDVGYFPNATLSADGELQAAYIGGGLKYAE